MPFTVIPMIRKALCDFYVASCTETGGAYRFRLYDDGSIEESQKIPMPDPMFLQLDGDVLWATLLHPFKDSIESGFAAYDTGSGNRITEIISTKGEVSCHIAASRSDVYCANYIGGSVFASSGRLSAHCGQGVDPDRQKSPHPHSVLFSPDERFLLSCDLGLDTIFVYDRKLQEVSRSCVPCGSGVRHAVFSGDGKYVYCINEMGGSISVFSWEAPCLTYINTVSILKSEQQEAAAGAAIKISKDGQYLYATERTTRTVVTLKAKGAHIVPIAYTDCAGTEPRDFTLLADDRFAVCTNQFSNNLSLFQIDADRTPRFLSRVELPAPLCAIEIAVP